jgi:uncharacterized protein
MPRVYDLSPLERDHIARTLAAALETDARVAFAYLHGSFVLESAFRDVDIAVFFDGSIEHPPERALEIGERLSALVHLPVDVRDLNTSPLTFRFHAVRGRLLCARDEGLLADVLEETMRQYFDVAPVLLHAAREAFGS